MKPSFPGGAGWEGGQVSLVVESAVTQTPTAGLKAAATTTPSNDGFSYNCAADTVWKPIWCNRFYGYGGLGGFGRYLGG